MLAIIFKKLHLMHKKLNQMTTYILYTDFSTAFLISFWLQDTIQNISRITESSFINKKKGYVCLSKEREKEYSCILMPIFFHFLREIGKGMCPQNSTNLTFPFPSFPCHISQLEENASFQERGELENRHESHRQSKFSVSKRTLKRKSPEFYAVLRGRS